MNLRITIALCLCVATMLHSADGKIKSLDEAKKQYAILIKDPRGNEAKIRALLAQANKLSGVAPAVWMREMTVDFNNKLAPQKVAPKKPAAQAEVKRVAAAQGAGAPKKPSVQPVAPAQPKKAQEQVEVKRKVAQQAMVSEPTVRHETPEEVAYFNEILNGMVEIITLVHKYEYAGKTWDDWSQEDYNALDAARNKVEKNDSLHNVIDVYLDFYTSKIDTDRLQGIIQPVVWLMSGFLPPFPKKIMSVRDDFNNAIAGRQIYREQITYSSDFAQQFNANLDKLSTLSSATITPEQAFRGLLYAAGNEGLITYDEDGFIKKLMLIADINQSPKLFLRNYPNFYLARFGRNELASQNHLFNVILLALDTVSSNAFGNYIDLAMRIIQDPRVRINLNDINEPSLPLNQIVYLYEKKPYYEMQSAQLKQLALLMLQHGANPYAQPSSLQGIKKYPIEEHYRHVSIGISPYNDALKSDKARELAELFKKGRAEYEANQKQRAATTAQALAPHQIPGPIASIINQYAGCEEPRDTRATELEQEPFYGQLPEVE